MSPGREVAEHASTGHAHQKVPLFGLTKHTLQLLPLSLVQPQVCWQPALMSPRFCALRATSADPPTPGARYPVVHMYSWTWIHCETQSQPRPQPHPAYAGLLLNQTQPSCMPEFHSVVSEVWAHEGTSGANLSPCLGLDPNLSPACTVAGPLGMDSGFSPTPTRERCTNDCAPPKAS